VIKEEGQWKSRTNGLSPAAWPHTVCPDKSIADRRFKGRPSDFFCLCNIAARIPTRKVNIDVAGEESIFISDHGGAR